MPKWWPKKCYGSDNNILCWLSTSRRRYNQYPLTEISLFKSDLDLNTSISLWSLQSKRTEASMLLRSKPQPPPSLSLSLSLSQSKHKATLWTQSFQTIIEVWEAWRQGHNHWDIFRPQAKWQRGGSNWVEGDKLYQTLPAILGWQHVRVSIEQILPGTSVIS